MFILVDVPTFYSVKKKRNVKLSALVALTPIRFEAPSGMVDRIFSSPAPSMRALTPITIPSQRMMSELPSKRVKVSR